MQCDVHLRKSPLRCILTAICALAAAIHCDVGHDANNIATAMLQYGELSQGPFGDVQGSSGQFRELPEALKKSDSLPATRSIHLQGLVV